jgi:hypothetical protein
MDECCGECCASIFKVPLKLFLLLFFLLLMLMIFISRELLGIIGMAVICVFVGMFGFSFELISETEGCMAVLAMIFFPVTMLFGIGRAFQEIYCETVSAML